MKNLHAREVLALTIFILIIVFLVSHKVFVESETEKGSIIQEIKFKDNLIDYVIIDNEMLTSNTTIFKINPSSNEKTSYVRKGNHATIYYKNGYKDFIADYKEK